MTSRQDANALPFGRADATARVLVASDDAEVRSLIEFALRTAGFAVETVVCATLLSSLAQHPCQLLLLDIDARGLGGMGLCEQVRQISAAPMLVLINQSSEQVLLQIMEAGADCYVVRPFSMRALIARVKAMLRRGAVIDAGRTRYVEAGGYRLDVEAHTLSIGSTSMQLTRLEAAAARVLMQNTDQPVTASALIAEVWNAYSRGNRNMLKQIVFRVRRKLASDVHAGAGIVTIDGGYMWQSRHAQPGYALNAAREVRAGK